MTQVLSEGRTWSATQSLLERLETQVLPDAPEGSRFYGWEPLPLVDFMGGMSLVDPPGEFLDVGSGIGSKAHLATQLGWEAHGIELHQPYIDTSLEIFPEIPVALADAFEFLDYDAYDLVYCYRPCVDPGDQHELNHIIAERMKPGAMFFSAGGPWPYWLEHVGGQVWRT